VTRTLQLGALGSIAILVLGVAAASSDAARESEDLELTILSTSSNRGEVDPCG
jgi:hypothetical protein